MSNPTPSHPQILSAYIDKRLKSVRVALPARVESYNATTNAIEVQPLIMDGDPDPDLDGVRRAVPVPKLKDVPVMFPGSGAYRVTWPVTVGDTVLLVFSSSAIDYWLAVGGMVDPGDDRRHDVSDAIAIPGLFDFSHIPTAAPTNAMVFHASSALLGGPSASQSMIRGEAFMSALDTLIGAIQSAVGTIAGGGAAATAIGVAKTAFDAAAVTFKSATMKVA